MPRFAANLSFLFNEVPFLERFAAARRNGFDAVEFMFPYVWPAEYLKALLDEHDLSLVLFNAAEGNWEAGERGLAALPGREADFDAAITRALAYARVLDTKLIHIMSGLDQHGALAETLVANLARGATRAADDGVTLVIEPINTRDMPGYFLNRTRQALDILAAVGQPNVGLQFDLYHRHMMEGDVAGGMAEAWPAIRHMQIAAPPDRGEPDDAALHFKPLFDQIDAGGFDGYVGLEYKPRAGTEAGFAWAARHGVTFGSRAGRVT